MPQDRADYGLPTWIKDKHRLILASMTPKQVRDKAIEESIRANPGLWKLKIDPRKPE